MTQAYRCDETRKETKSDSNLFSAVDCEDSSRRIFRCTTPFKSHLCIRRSKDGADHFLRAVYAMSAIALGDHTTRNSFKARNFCLRKILPASLAISIGALTA